MKGLRAFAQNVLMKKGVFRSVKELLAEHTRRDRFHLPKTKFELPLDDGRAVMIREIRATGIHRDILRVWFIGKDHLGDHYTILFIDGRQASVVLERGQDLRAKLRDAAHKFGYVNR